MNKSFALVLGVSLILSILTGCNTDENAIDTSTESVVSSQTDDLVQESPVSDFEYSENSDGGITIDKYIGSDDDVAIPEQIDGKDVTVIGKWAFEAQSIVSVTLPDTVTDIAVAAFARCYSLETVALSEKLVNVEGSAFSECSKLSSIVLPDTLKTIGSNAFEKCACLKHITIPAGVRGLGFETFCLSGLETIEIENGVETIGESAFAGTQIEEVVLPESVREISWQAFGGCPNLESVILNEGLTTIKAKAFTGASKLTEIIIPRTVVDMTEMAFDRCTALEKVKFEGNAPEGYIEEEIGFVYPASGETIPPDYRPYRANGVDYTIYYHEGAEGFTSPEWCDYKTEIW